MLGRVRCRHVGYDSRSGPADRLSRFGWLVIPRWPQTRKRPRTEIISDDRTGSGIVSAALASRPHHLDGAGAGDDCAGGFRLVVLAFPATLRNCLVLSLAAHLGLVLYGSTIPAVMWTIGSARRDAPDRAHVRQIRVASLHETSDSSRGSRSGDAGRLRQPTDRWDVASGPLTLADASLKNARPKFEEVSTPLRESGITPAPMAPGSVQHPPARILRRRVPRHAWS